MRRARLLCLLVLYGCDHDDAPPNAVAETDDPTGTGDVSTTGDASTDPSTGGAASTTSTSSGEDESSTGVDLCGNGIVDPGEECDDDSEDCIDCNIPCGVGSLIDVDLGQPSYPVKVTAPFAVGGGSTDLIVPAGIGISRVSMDGGNQWSVATQATEFVTWIERADDTSVWVTYVPTTTSPAGTLSALRRQSIADGGLLDAFALPALDADHISYAAQVAVLPDSRVLVHSGQWSDPDTRDSVLDWLTPDGSTVQQSATISFEPNADGFAGAYPWNMRVADDGTIWLMLGVTADDFNEPFLVRLDEDGTEQWRRRLMEGDPDLAAGGVFDVVDLDGGDVAALAVLRDSVHPALAPGQPRAEARIIRMSADGTPIWELDAKEIDPDAWFQLNGLRARGDELVVSGTWMSQGQLAGLTATVDPEDGTVLCAEIYGHDSGLPTLGERFFDAADGSLWVIGSYQDPDILDNAATGVWIAPVY